MVQDRSRWTKASFFGVAHPFIRRSLSTGETRYLPSEITDFLQELGITTEVMDTPNALATFNFLNQEGRRCAGAILTPEPYDRTEELVGLADHVANISAKHEGGTPEVDAAREHPSDILDYFRDKEEILESGDGVALERNYLDKHDAVNRTARALTEKGLSFIAAQNLHQ